MSEHVKFKVLKDEGWRIVLEAIATVDGVEGRTTCRIEPAKMVRCACLVEDAPKLLDQFRRLHERLKETGGDPRTDREKTQDQQLLAGHDGHEDPTPEQCDGINRKFMEHVKERALREARAIKHHRDALTRDGGIFDEYEVESLPAPEPEEEEDVEDDVDS